MIHKNYTEERITISKIEAENIKAKTRFINNVNIREWVSTIIRSLLGLLLIITGFFKFLGDSNNSYFIALIIAGAFILSLSKTKIEEVLKGFK